jgi:hypothetical protein
MRFKYLIGIFNETSLIERSVKFKASNFNFSIPKLMWIYFFYLKNIKHSCTVS